MAKIVFSSPAEAFRKSAEGIKLAMAIAATGAVRDAGAEVKTGARANIAAAGFGVRWQNTLRVNLYPSSGVSMGPAAYMYHKIPYAGVFEQGASIAGDPLLWLPLPGVPQSMLGVHMSPANYTRLIGPLHTIFVAGKPPMLAGWIQGGVRGVGVITVRKLRSGAWASKRGTKNPGLVSVPLFIGLDSVTIGKKFDLQGVADKARAGLVEGYFRNLKVG